MIVVAYLGIIINFLHNELEKVENLAHDVECHCCFEELFYIVKNIRFIYIITVLVAIYTYPHYFFNCCVSEYKVKTIISITYFM